MPQKVVIIGAGIIGASLAYYLSREGAEVTVIDKGQPGMETTSKSFAWINANFPETPEYFAFRMKSIREYHHLAAELKSDTGLSWGGSLWFESDDEEFDRYIGLWKDLEYEYEIISRNQFANLERNLANPPDRAIRFNLEGSAEPVQLTNRLLACAQEFGAKLISECEFLDFKTKASRVVGITASTGDFVADTVVAASGLNNQKIAKKLDLDLPMDNREGVQVKTKPLPTILQHVMLGPDLHFRQQLDGRIIMGEDYSGTFSGEDPHALGQTLVDLLRIHLADVEHIELEKVTVGSRPIPADGFPVLGAPVGVDGFYLASMHSGITLAPIVGKLGSGEILKEKREDQLSPYRLERFGHQA